MLAETYNLIATAAFGLESVVGRELYRLGYREQRTENGRVCFKGDGSAIARCNLWLRSADRVLIEVGRFTATSFEELFQGVRALPWEEYIALRDAFPVSGKAIASQLMSVSDCQAITKKAIVEKMKETHHLPWFDEDGPTVKVEVGLLKDTATLTIDTSGAGLHKRGYRKLNAVAPLRETLAAALVQLSRWHPERALIDPMCGSGTIPIEAALLAQNRAPGLGRTFAAEQFAFLPSDIWREARAEALDAAKNDHDGYIAGTDIDEEVLSLARYHAKAAGVNVHFQRQDLREMRTKREYGFLITNPPYGERMGDRAEAERIIASLGTLKKALRNWGVFVISPHERFERLFGARADVRRKLYNGAMQCQFYQYLGPKPPWLEKTVGQHIIPGSDEEGRI